MPATDETKFAALSTADRLAVRLKSLRQNRTRMADLRRRRAEEPPHVTAGRIADALKVAGGPLHRNALRRKLNLSSAAMTAGIEHGVANGFFGREDRPSGGLGVPAATYLHPTLAPRKYRKSGDDEAYNGEFRRLAQEHFDRLPPADQERHRPKLDKFLAYNHMKAVTAEMLKRGGTPDDAHDLAVRMIYGGVSHKAPPLFAAHDLDKSSYLTRFVHYRNGLVADFRHRGAETGGGEQPVALSELVGRRRRLFNVAKPVRSTDLMPANAPPQLEATDLRTATADARPDARAGRLKQVAQLLREKKSLAQIGDALGLKSKASVKRWADEAKLKYAAEHDPPKWVAFPHHPQLDPPHPLFDNDAGKALRGLYHGLRSLKPDHDLLPVIDEAFKTASAASVAAVQDYVRSMPDKAVGWMVRRGHWADAVDHALLSTVADDANSYLAWRATDGPHRYNKVEYFADLAAPEAVLRYARWRSRPYYVVFRTKGGKKKRRIVRFDGTHDDLRAECEKRGHKLLHAEPATDAHAEVVGAASGGGE